MAVPALAGRHGVADERLMIFDDVRDVAQPQGAGTDPLDRDLRELQRRGDRGDVLDGQALAGGFDEPAGARRRRLNERERRHP